MGRYSANISLFRMFFLLFFLKSITCDGKTFSTFKQKKISKIGLSPTIDKTRDREDLQYVWIIFLFLNWSVCIAHNRVNGNTS